MFSFPSHCTVATWLFLWNVLKVWSLQDQVATNLKLCVFFLDVHKVCNVWPEKSHYIVFTKGHCWDMLLLHSIIKCVTCGSSSHSLKSLKNIQHVQKWYPITISLFFYLQKLKCSVIILLLLVFCIFPVLFFKVMWILGNWNNRCTIRGYNHFFGANTMCLLCLHLDKHCFLDFLLF